MAEQAVRIAIAKLSIEYWRITRSYERNLPNMLNSASSAVSTIRNSEKKFLAILLENGISLQQYEGQDYSANLPLTVINTDEFDGNENLIVQQMLEPTLIDGKGIIHIGKAILSRKAD